MTRIPYDCYYYILSWQFEWQEISWDCVATSRDIAKYSYYFTLVSKNYDLPELKGAIIGEILSNKGQLKLKAFLIQKKCYPWYHGPTKKVFRSNPMGKIYKIYFSTSALVIIQQFGNNSLWQKQIQKLHPWKGANAKWPHYGRQKKSSDLELVYVSRASRTWNSRSDWAEYTMFR